MRAALTVGLIFLLEPAAQGSPALTPSVALGLATVITGLVAVGAINRIRTHANHEPNSAICGVGSPVRSVLEIARDTGYSQDAVRQMTRRTMPAGRPAISGKACRINRKPAERVVIDTAGRHLLNRYTAIS